jgi:zinc and cadmium transporter
MHLQIFIAGIAIVLTSLSGKLFTYGILGNFTKRNLKFLISFALGTFSASLYLLLSEITKIGISTITLTVSIISGIVLLETLQRMLPDAHHHHGLNKDDCCSCDKQSEHKINPMRILLGDAMHNVGDGIVLVSAYLISFTAGLTLTIGILLHEFVQETSEFFILKESGYSTKRALLSNLAVSSTLFIGMILSIFITVATTYTPILMAISIGALLYIIFRDLLPHTIRRVRHGGRLITHITLFVLGAAVMLTIGALIPA